MHCFELPILYIASSINIHSTVSLFVIAKCSHDGTSCLYVPVVHTRPCVNGTYSLYVFTSCICLASFPGLCVGRPGNEASHV